MNRGTRIPRKKESVIYRDRPVPGTSHRQNDSSYFVSVGRRVERVAVSAARNAARKVIVSSGRTNEEQQVLVVRATVDRAFQPISTATFVTSFKYFDF